MENQDLIAKIQGLRAIKPSRNWVSTTKAQLFAGPGPSLRGARPGPISIFALPGQALARAGTIFSPFQFRPALALYALLLLMIVGGFVFWLSFESVPGEPLHSVERLAERGQAAFLALDKVEFQLDLAEKRVAELKAIVQSNEVEKLGPALKEYQEDLKKAIESFPENPGNPEKTLKIAERVNKIEKETKEIEAALQIGVGVAEREELKSKAVAYLEAGIEETKNELAEIAEREIENLRNSSLTETQQGLLEEAERYFEQGDYQAALENLLLAGQIR